MGFCDRTHQTYFPTAQALVTQKNVLLMSYLGNVIL